MAPLAPLLFGPLRSHPAAIPFAAEVVRVHRRYATEVVAAHRLCPFVRDVDIAFGRFCVVLAEDPSLEAARAAYVEAENPVLHLVYPISRVPTADFERFGADVGKLAREIWRAAPVDDARLGPEPPVIATFHPRLAGDRGTPHRLIGTLRRAPDPFVQIIPGGHHESGTVVAPVSDYLDLAPEALAKLLKAIPPPAKDRAHETFTRLTPADLDAIDALIADIHADRDRSYAPFLKELGCTRLTH
ncbi:MAG: hypothetical protein R3F14_25415 [Polyangiaceae bacterium]